MSDGFDQYSHGDLAFTRKSPYGTVIEPTYSGATSFLRRRYSRDLDGVDVAVVGVPYDLATSNRSGARLGPRAIRAASTQLSWSRPWPWEKDPTELLHIVDYGDCVFDPGRPLQAVDEIQAGIARIVSRGVIPLTLGGDHFISYPILKAIHAEHGPVCLIHFDAHSDTWADQDGRIDHGTMFYHAAQQALVDVKHSVQLGMRTVNDETHGYNVFDANFLHKHGVERTVQEIKNIVADKPCYVTFDIDFLDPAFAPGTGTPVCGGFSTAFAVQVLHGLAGIHVVGADVVEVAPAYDHAEITALAGATMAAHMLCLMAASPKK